MTLLTFCTNEVLLRTMMAGDDILSTVTHVIVVSLRCMSFYIGVPDINSMFIEFCNI